MQQSKLHVRLQICSKLYFHGSVGGGGGGWLDSVVIIPPQPSQAGAGLGFWIG